MPGRRYDPVSHMLLIDRESAVPPGHAEAPIALKVGNKGRLHAFRKVTSDANHALQQKQNVGIGMSTSIDICVSVAWDWMFKGK